MLRALRVESSNWRSKLTKFSSLYPLVKFSFEKSQSRTIIMPSHATLLRIYLLVCCSRTWGFPGIMFIVIVLWCCSGWGNPRWRSWQRRASRRENLCRSVLLHLCDIISWLCNSQQTNWRMILRWAVTFFYFIFSDKEMSDPGAGPSRGQASGQIDLAGDHS